MFPIESFRETTQRLAAVLQSLKIRFHLTGGVVSVAWGEPRFTQDIDVVLDREALAQHLEEFLAGLRGLGFHFQDQVVKEAISRGRPFQMLDAVECLKLDLYPRELVPGELERSVPVEVFAGTMLPVVSLPDAAVSKLIWISKGSHKSRQDLRRLARHLSAADMDFLRHQAVQRQLESLLQEVLSESDEILE
jgi:hypothetical protein